VIASLRGIVLSTTSGTIVLEVGGVGYSVSTIPKESSRYSVGQEVFLHTSFIVREDAHLLFGFETEEALETFDLLRSVSGVGPKSAQAVLASMSLTEIASAVISENDAAFRRVTGIGPKTAKLIIVSLGGKLTKLAASESTNPVELAAGSAERAIAEASAAVIEALLGLGYQERTVAPLVNEISNGLQTTNRNELLRAALARLGTSKPVIGAGE
jgi:Holliday junction DNA helicase RuvA